MRRTLRFLLLAMGCVVMVATSPSDGPYGSQVISLPLQPGRAVTVYFAAGRMENAEPVAPLVPRVHLRGLPYEVGASARVVGIVSSAPPTREKYSRLEPRGTFTVGQEVDGMGTVAFVREVPFDTRSAEEGPWVLPGAEGYYLTVFAQNGALELELSMPQEEMQSECDCQVGFGFEWREERNYFSESDPDGGVGGRDGG